MNSPFMFTPQLNPFADNPKYIKKALSKRPVFICVLSMSVLLVTMIFGAACFFNLKSIQPLIETQSEEEVNIMLSTSEGLFQIFCSLIMFLPFLAFIMILVRLRSDDYELNAAPFILLRLFLIVTVISSISGIFSSITSLLNGDMISNEKDIQKVLIPFIVNGIPALFAFLWSLAGLLFCNSVISTLQKKQLESKFGKTYMAFSLIYSFVLFAVTIYYYADEFKHGMFESSGLASTSIKSIIIQSMPMAYVMFAVYYICCITVILSTARIAKQYIYAVSAALRSFQTSGSNLFMNSDSNAAAYFNQTYTAPSDSPSAPPPVSSQQFDSISSDAFKETPEPSGQQTENTSESSVYPNAFSMQNNTYICKRCGKENTIENKFCTSCGNNRFGT